jgi:hypothetical protein
MREIVFRVLSEQPGRLEARAEDRPITITAASLEELHHEAREALIEHLGPAHGTFRVRIRRHGVASAARPIRRQHAACTPAHCSQV